MPFPDQGTPPLTVTYLTASHQACAHQLSEWMQACGFDEVRTDSVGNVVGLYHSHSHNHAPQGPAY